MKFIGRSFLLMLSFLTFAAFSQPNYYKIQGSWISVKNLSKSTNEKADDYYVKFTFKGSKLFVNSTPTVSLTANPIVFEVFDNIINTGQLEETGYIIEKASKDTLVLADSFDNKRSRRFIFVNEQSLINQNLAKLGENKILIADRYCTPSQKKNLQDLVYGLFKGKINEDFDVTGTLKINVHDKEVETIVASENLDERRLKKLKSTLDGSFDYWDLSLFQKFKVIEMPFVIHAKRVKEFENLRIDFF